MITQGNENTAGATDMREGTSPAPGRQPRAAGQGRRSGVLRGFARAVSCLGLLGGPALAGEAESLPPAAVRDVDFIRDIQPLFQAHCVECHGPRRQKGGLRLDRRADALRGGDHHGRSIVPGNSADSSLIRLAAGLEPEARMPANGDPLTPEQIGLLRAWIDQGASWPDDGSVDRESEFLRHWAFQPVIRPEVPQVATRTSTPPNPIDAFIDQRLALNGLERTREADRATLARRLSFGLLGLPPTPEEVSAFAEDPRPDAYERLVERLLAAPRYGERWARHWLDVVRYAETHGFEMNNPRPNAWPYRDYVVKAFNDDLPYDQFIREQLAGDALGADAATGFLVAGPWDQVKSPDEVLTRNQRADELHDIINTAGTAFLGLTVGCARCHDHKFDPIPQRDYFAMKGVFDGVAHGERELRPPDFVQRTRRLEDLRRELGEVETRLDACEPLARTVMDAGAEDGAQRRSSVHRGRNLDRFAPVDARFLRFTIVATTGAEPCLDELEVFTAEPEARNVALAGPGIELSSSGNYAGSPFHKLEHLNDGHYGNERSWISNEAGRGWVQIGFPRVERIDRVAWSRDRSPKPVYADRLATRYRIEVSLDGETWETVASEADRWPVKDPARPESGNATRGLTPEEIEARRTLVDRAHELRKAIGEGTSAPRVYAGTFNQPEPTRRFHRGDPMQPREIVPPGVLSFEPFRPGAPEIDKDLPEQQRRLRLAEWIASTRNPLTARVMVNRIWQYHFGEGLVATPSDFGLNGARPSHPDLLDWLAAEFMAPTVGCARPWSLKHLHRLIVSSAAYRQDSRADPGRATRAERVDAGNRLLWRFPPLRLDAEPLRDTILAVAGRLDLRMGGPGWSPFEPNENYVRVYTPKETFGPEDFRRMIYATVVRQRPDGVFGAFDCPDGGQIAPKRTRSITPLQALNLLNSGFMMQVSGFFAGRLERDAGPEVAAQVRRGFLLAYQREPSADELQAASALVRTDGLPVFCRALLNANEFVFVY